MDVDDVKRLYYTELLSTREIGLKLNKTVWQVIKFMKKHNLPRRKCFETLHYVIKRQPKTFEKKKNLSSSDRNLHLAGLMLYWAEGVKARKSTVDLANSDPVMVQLFLRMLRTIYQINESKLRILLYCYSNQNIVNLVKYWSNLLSIPKQQFIKPYIRADYRLDKTTKMPYGVAHVRYNDTKLHCEITHDIGIMAVQLTT